MMLINWLARKLIKRFRPRSFAQSPFIIGVLSSLSVAPAIFLLSLSHVRFFPCQTGRETKGQLTGYVFRVYCLTFVYDTYRFIMLIRFQSKTFHEQQRAIEIAIVRHCEVPFYASCVSLSPTKGNLARVFQSCRGNFLLIVRGETESKFQPN